ncbi:MAG: HAD-IA family hydrolase [Erysipelothrix sp.]|nr:HAD-IA family hydrolase [Erysipelothrix sp.]
MKIKAIYFDLDGTLLDTLQDIHEALNYTLEELGKSLVTFEQTRSFVGNGLRNVLRHALSSDDVDYALERFHHHYSTHLVVNTMPYEGVVQLLEELKKMDIKLGVISNKTDAYVHRLVDHFFSDTFNVVIGERTDLKRKPHRDMLDYALKETNNVINEIIFVGDSLVDASFIKDHQIHGALLTYGFDDEANLIPTKLPCFKDIASLRSWILSHLSV